MAPFKILKTPYKRLQDVRNSFSPNSVAKGMIKIVDPATYGSETISKPAIKSRRRLSRLNGGRRPCTQAKNCTILRATTDTLYSSSPLERRDNDIQRRRRFYERLSPRNPSPTEHSARGKDIAKEAKIWRWRRTRGGHKGNRAIIVNRLTNPPFHRRPSKRGEKRRRGEGSKQLHVNYPATDSDRTHFSIILSSPLTQKCRYSRGRICTGWRRNRCPNFRDVFYSIT